MVGRPSAQERDTMQASCTTATSVSASLPCSFCSHCFSCGARAVSASRSRHLKTSEITSRNDHVHLITQ